MRGKEISKLLIVLVIFASILLASCTSSLFVQPSATPTETATFTPEPPTSTPTPTELPTPTFTATPVMVSVKAGQDLTVPILLYHHISDDGTDNRYFISVDTFSQQMKWLYDNHYQTITVSQLQNLILSGGTMPERPVVITFDDGDSDVVVNALPIMQKYGFIASTYLIVTWIDTPGYISSDQVNQLIDAGWEIGSHSMTHVDLTQNKDTLSYEVRNSLVDLDDRFGITVRTFSYPFGMIDADVANSVSKSGYKAAVGLGTSTTHGLEDLYYLPRLEVRQEYSLDQFIALLPWKN